MANKKDKSKSEGERKKFIDLISAILTRKSLGMDCTEQESAELKQFVLTAIIMGRHLDGILVRQIINLFPNEYAEAVNQMLPSQKRKFLKQVELLLDEDDDENETNEDTEQIIDRIAEHLRYADGEWVAKIANQVLDATVTYKGDDFYSVEEN